MYCVKSYRQPFQVKMPVLKRNKKQEFLENNNELPPDLAGGTITIQTGFSQKSLSALAAYLAKADMAQLRQFQE